MIKRDFPHVQLCHPCMLRRNNSGIDFDTCQSKWLQGPETAINLSEINESIAKLCARRERTKSDKIMSLVRAVNCLDLTTLGGDDTCSNVLRLCHKAAEPLNNELYEKLNIPGRKICCAAVCVYPSKVSTCVQELRKLNARVSVAAVAGGFPSGQYLLKTKLEEIKRCAEDGATEIDIVINREYALCGDWKKLYEEVKSMREVVENCTLKAIIATGELGTLSNVYRASLVCMAAGADFIKTSTGKESVNATLTVGTVMARAIRDYCVETGFQVGFKPAGGIRTCKDVYLWQELMKEDLDPIWEEHPFLFRIGASSLLPVIEQTLAQCVSENVGEEKVPYL